MTWFEPWVGVLLGLALAARFGRDAVRQAAASATEERAAAPPQATMVRALNRVPTWLLVALVLLTLGPWVIELLT